MDGPSTPETGHTAAPGVALIDPPLDEAARNARVYGGEILVFRRVAVMAELCAAIAGHLRSRLGDDPEGAHTRLDAAALAQAAAALRREVPRDPMVSRALEAVLREVGVDVARTYADGLRLRIQPPLSAAHEPRLGPLPAHRDTWGSNVMAQTNWWAPVTPLAPARTIALFPALFRHAIDNDSAEWDLAELLRRRRAGTAADYPRLPTARCPPAPQAGQAMAVDPGDLMCFSGAHLHASVPNTTGRTRFSIEIRTVNGDDAAAGRGAANVDGRAPRVARHWFRRLADDERLGDMA